MDGKKAFYRALGKRVRRYRMASEMTQRELAEEVGVKHNTISYIECARHEPSVFIVYRIGAVLGCGIEELTGRWE